MRRGRKVQRIVMAVVGILIVLSMVVSLFARF